ncbi:MAG: hypothetical protein IJ335_06155 [Lachnospiraceae bacterium]|nr:hypothetical protein [Lachnospiraceae bacterium]
MRNVEVKRRQIQMLTNALMIAVLMILGSNTGNMGLLILAIAIEMSTFVITLISGNMSDVLGKLLRSRIAKHQYRNAIQIKKIIGVIQLILGIFGTILLLLLTEKISSNLFPVSNSYYLMLILSPLILLRSMIHVLLGYFQGEGNEFPAVAIAVGRPMFLLIFGLQLSQSFREQGMQVADLLKQEVFQYVYGAMGAAWAMVITEAILVLALVVFYVLSHRDGKKKSQEGHKATDSVKNLLRIIVKNRWQPMLLGILMSLPLWGILIGMNRPGCIVNFDSYVLFYAKLMAFFGILFFLLAALFLPMQGRAVYILKNEGSRYASESLRRAISYIFVVVAFVLGYCLSMGEHIAKMLYKTKPELLMGWIPGTAILLLTLSLIYFMVRLLYLLGKRLLLLAIFGGCDILYIILTAFSVVKHGMPVEMIIRNLLIYTVVLCVILGFFCFCYFRLGAELLLPIFSTALAAALMYLIQIVIKSVLAPHLGNVVTMLVIFVLTLVAYLLAILLLRIFKDSDLEVLPGGRLFLALGQMLHLY